MPTFTDAEFEAEVASRIAAATAPLLRNRNDLLARNRALKLKAGDAYHSDVHRDDMHAFADRPTVKVAADAPSNTITREQARDPALYRAARLKAEAEGRHLVIIDESARAATAPDAPSRLKVGLVTDTGERWFSQAYVDKIGLTKLRAEIGPFRTYRTAAHLPAELQPKYARVVAQGDPETFLSDDAS